MAAQIRFDFFKIGLNSNLLSNLNQVIIIIIIITVHVCLIYNILCAFNKCYNSCYFEKNSLSSTVL